MVLNSRVCIHRFFTTIASRSPSHLANDCSANRASLITGCIPPTYALRKFLNGFRFSLDEIPPARNARGGCRQINGAEGQQAKRKLTIKEAFQNMALQSIAGVFGLGFLLDEQHKPVDSRTPILRRLAFIPRVPPHTYRHGQRQARESQSSGYTRSHTPWGQSSIHYGLAALDALISVMSALLTCRAL
jgi:hypothetical protein